MKTLDIVARTLFLGTLVLQFAVAAAQSASLTAVKNEENINPKDSGEHVSKTRWLGTVSDQSQGIPPATVQQSGIVRTDLQRHDISVAWHEAIQARVDFKPHTAFGMHAHPGEEIIYVLEGTLEYELEGDRPITLKAGDVLFVPAGRYHSARNTGNVNAAELATYVVEKNKPLLVLKK